MKKLINILSTISLVALTRLSTISCKEKTYPNLSLKQEETYIVKALNQKQPNNLLKNNFDKLTMDDILLPSNYSINYDIKTNILNYKNIEIKEDANTFLNNNYQYRIPQINGSFNLQKNTIKNSEYQIKYNTGNYQNYLKDTANILTGTTDNFTLIMNYDNWNGFLWSIDNNIVNDYLKNIHLFNSHIVLSNEEWKNILLQLTNRNSEAKYCVAIYVSNKKIIYQDIKVDGTTDIPSLPSLSLLPLFSFESNAITDGSVLSKDNKFITLNQDILEELKDIYNDKTSYHQINWNIPIIEKLLQNNKYCNTNLDYQIIATCIYSNWNIELVNNLLASNHNYFILQYDQNNNYIKNNWNI